MTGMRHQIINHYDDYHGCFGHENLDKLVRILMEVIYLTLDFGVRCLVADG